MQHPSPKIKSVAFWKPFYNVPWDEAIILMVQKVAKSSASWTSFWSVAWGDTIILTVQKVSKIGLPPKTTTMGSVSRRTQNRPLSGRPFEALLETIRPFWWSKTWSKWGQWPHGLAGWLAGWWLAGWLASIFQLYSYMVKVIYIY